MYLFASLVRSAAIAAMVAGTLLALELPVQAQGIFADPNQVLLDPSRPPSPYLEVVPRTGVEGRTALCRRNPGRTEFIVRVRNIGNAESKSHTFTLTLSRSGNLVTSMAERLPAIAPGHTVNIHFRHPEFLRKNRFDFSISHVRYYGHRVGGVCVP